MSALIHKSSRSALKSLTCRLQQHINNNNNNNNISSSSSSQHHQHHQLRPFSLHEYQSHELFAKYGITIPRGVAVRSVDEVDDAIRKINNNPEGGSSGSSTEIDHTHHSSASASSPSHTVPGHCDYVVKAQVLAGGRGKGTFTNGFKGGVHTAYTADQVKEYTSNMIGKTLVTKQTGPTGKPVNVVFIQERVYARRELYFAIMLDRKTEGPLIIGSQSGGMSIEDVARENPDAIVQLHVDINKGLQRDMVVEFVRKLGFRSSSAGAISAVEQVEKLYKLFCDTDATLVEVNPMIETPRDGVVCADAKINIDESAAEFRQPELAALRDWTQEDYREQRAALYGLNYIGLDGNIGCIVNGAGLAMATMDIIKMNGGAPANFLDVGGGATQEQIIEALKILNSDVQVKAILVNIFGGIMKCDVIAMGLINAANQVALRAPLVVRLQGTNVEAARRIMEESGVKIIPAKNLDDAASKAVKVARIVEQASDLNIKVSFEIPI